MMMEGTEAHGTGREELIQARSKPDPVAVASPVAGLSCLTGRRWAVYVCSEFGVTSYTACSSRRI